MEIPNKIQFKKDFKDESKVFAVFTTNDYPEFIRVKGTDDFAKVKKKQKEWFSKCKYPNLSLTLQLFKNNDIVAEPTYLADGTLYTPPASNICEIINFDASPGDSGTSVNIVWQSVTESNIKNYVLYSQETPESGYNIVNDNILPKGNNVGYQIIDNFTFDKSLAIYTLQVKYNDDFASIVGRNPVYEENFL
ncbi:MAG: hypothetical protein SFY32_02150 [Bacteroidota bacterium]|nr:hypothetical protein [Bacteroidota bacterium]